MWFVVGRLRYFCIRIRYITFNVVSGEVSERGGLPDPVIGTMYSSTTLREVTVVDGVQLIIASPPARDHWNADGSAHMWRPSPSYSACTFIFEAVVTRRGSRCSLHKSRPPARFRRALRPVLARCRSLHVRVTDPMDARRRFYFGKIQIWNGWYSRVVSELRRLTPFLELVCACAATALPVLSEQPSRRVARHPHVAAVSRRAASNPITKRWRDALSLGWILLTCNR